MTDVLHPDAAPPPDPMPLASVLNGAGSWLTSSPQHIC